MGLNTGNTIVQGDFIKKADANAVPANDVNRVPKLESDGKLDPFFINHSYGGSGADGALSISSGTTNLDAAGARVLVKNYTSVSITGTATLSVSNPHDDGTILIIKTTGNFTCTSSGGIDLSSKGSIGGASDGADANEPTSFFLIETAGGDGGKASSGGASVAGSMANSRKLLTISADRLHSKAVQLSVGAGGGAGKNNTGGNAGGAGGRGGGCLYVECNGAFNFTTGTINVSGANGSNGTATGSNDGPGGGGGGGGGMVVVLYKTLTANSGTINANGGAGGSSQGLGTTNAPGGGGAGGASPNGNGGAGGATVDGGAYDGGVAGTTGGGGGGSGGRVGSGTQAGASGGTSSNSVITQNIYFN
jgi:hypothetical protein